MRPKRNYSDVLESAAASAGSLVTPSGPTKEQQRHVAKSIHRNSTDREEMVMFARMLGLMEDSPDKPRRKTYYGLQKGGFEK